jgi:hypothetical protein
MIRPTFITAACKRVGPIEPLSKRPLFEGYINCRSDTTCHDHILSHLRGETFLCTPSVCVSPILSSLHWWPYPAATPYLQTLKAPVLFKERCSFPFLSDFFSFYSFFAFFRGVFNSALRLAIALLFPHVSSSDGFLFSPVLKLNSDSYDDGDVIEPHGALQPYEDDFNAFVDNAQLVSCDSSGLSVLFA